MEQGKDPTPSPLPQIYDYEPLGDGRIAVAKNSYIQAIQFNKLILDGIARQKIERAGTVHQTLERIFASEELEALDFEERRRRAPPRRIGHLGSPNNIRREMAQLYRESYAEGLEASRYFTRLMYMLDCLLRATKGEQGQTGPEADD